MSYQTEVVADSPWLYWRLDDPSGTTAADTSGNSRTGTYSGGPTLAQTGLITDGTAVHFDAVNDYCLSTSAIFNSSTATVEVWFDYDGTPSPASEWWLIAGCNEGAGGTAGDKLVMIDQNGKAVFLVYDGSLKLAVGATTLSAGTYHLVGVIDDPNNLATIYVNGVSDGTIAAGSSYTGYSAANVIVAGYSGGGNYTRKAGRRDEFAIYTTALSGAQILAHYNAGLAADVSAPQVLSMLPHVSGHNVW